MKNRLTILLVFIIFTLTICGCSSTSSADSVTEEPLIEVTADDEPEDAVPAASDIVGEAIEDTATSETDTLGLSDSNLSEEALP